MKKWIAGGVIAFCLVRAAVQTPPLSSEEQRLVGAWTYLLAAEPRVQRVFEAERRFRLVFEPTPGTITCVWNTTGTWQIRDGELVLIYDPSSLFFNSWSVRDVWIGIRQRWIDANIERSPIAFRSQNEVDMGRWTYRRLAKETPAMR